MINYLLMPVIKFPIGDKLNLVILDIPYHFSCKHHSTPLSDSTISNFLILRENIRLTKMDNAKVITAANRKFVSVIEGRI